MSNEVHSRRVRELPALLANQIAAGEVVERPASVAKELLENSLDANARWIDVEVEQGGVRLIRVRDDGDGIYSDDLAVALRRHATSKITTLDDLEQVQSLGFRGEALPSIASVSRLTLSSRCRGEEHGWRVSADEGGDSLNLTPVAHPFGTSVEVRDLFFSTPARRKFLRSERTEQRHLQQVVKRVALSRFDVGFQLRCDGSSMLRLSPASTEQVRLQRLAKICGTAFAQCALQLEFEAAGLRLSGWVADAAFSRGAADMQHLFVNGRWVRESAATHAVRQAYGERMPNDRYPAYVLYIDIDPRAVDVNVHPAKHEIRFRQVRLIHDFLSRSVARALAEAAAGAAYPPVSLSSLELPAVADRNAVKTGWSPVLGADAVPRGAGWMPSEVLRHPTQRPNAASAKTVNVCEPRPLLGYALGLLAAGPYLVAENAEGLVLVDVQAARSQIIYQQLRAADQEGSLPRCPLLLPVALSVQPREMKALEAAEGVLDRLGFELRAVGPETLSVRQITSLVQGATIADLIREVLSCLVRTDDDDGVSNRDALLQTMADQGAAGRKPPRTLPEMNALLREMEAVGVALARNSFGSCWVQLSTDEIRQLFRQDGACGERRRGVTVLLGER